jgi:hypothetical protein
VCVYIYGLMHVSFRKEYAHEMLSNIGKYANHVSSPITTHPPISHMNKWTAQYRSGATKFRSGQGVYFPPKVEDDAELDGSEL